MYLSTSTCVVCTSMYVKGIIALSLDVLDCVRLTVSVCRAVQVIAPAQRGARARAAGGRGGRGGGRGRRRGRRLRGGGGELREVRERRARHLQRAVLTLSKVSHCFCVVVVLHFHLINQDRVLFIFSHKYINSITCFVMYLIKITCVPGI